MHGPRAARYTNRLSTDGFVYLVAHGPCGRFAAPAEPRRLWRTRSDRLAAPFVLRCFVPPVKTVGSIAA